MNIDTVLKKVLTEKKELIEASKLCTKSIDFWEKKSNVLFEKMDAAEEEYALSTDEYIEDTCTQYLKEIDSLMKRMTFENDQLDALEAKIEKLQIKTSLLLTEHAKKQKK